MSETFDRGPYETRMALAVAVIVTRWGTQRVTASDARRTGKPSTVRQIQSTLEIVPRRPEIENLIHDVSAAPELDEMMVFLPVEHRETITSDFSWLLASACWQHESLTRKLALYDNLPEFQEYIAPKGTTFDTLAVEVYLVSRFQQNERDLGGTHIVGLDDQRRLVQWFGSARFAHEKTGRRYVLCDVVVDSNYEYGGRRFTGVRRKWFDPA